jgi:N-acetylneuraminate synthase
VAEAHIEINGRTVGPGHPVYVVAEMSANHNHIFDRAVSIVRAAKEAGADAVKLQTYTADTLTIDCDNEHFRVGVGTIWEGETLYGLYQRAATPWEWHRPLLELAGELGLDCFSTPFDDTAVEFLEELEMPAHKVASFEITDLELLARIGRTGKPVILSTGMATADEIQEAITTLAGGGAGGIALLKCTSSYPAPIEDADLRTIPHMAREFGRPVGLSDHSFGTVVPIAATALGACIIEKHLTVSRGDPGPDSAFSLEPDEFRAMVTAVRDCENSLGSVRYGTSDSEGPSAMFRRSLFAVKDVKRGEELTRDNVRSIRPGAGLHPRHLGEILGRRAARDVKRGTPLSWDLIS